MDIPRCLIKYLKHFNIFIFFVVHTAAIDDINRMSLIPDKYVKSMSSHLLSWTHKKHTSAGYCFLSSTFLNHLSCFMASRHFLQGLRYQYFLATFMFKYYHGALPPNVRHSSLRVCDKHHYSTRAATSCCLSLSKPRTELLKRRLLYSGPFVWNSLPNHLKQATSILSFKRLYKFEFGFMYKFCLYLFSVL